MFTLSPLPYAYDALEPYISKETLTFHHDKHHQAYVNKLNEILQPYPELAQMELVALLQNLDQVPESVRQAVINNAGQVYNHDLYWQSMGPNAGGEPVGELAEKISQTFGGFENFKTEFSNAGVTQFGSGWAWLCVDDNSELHIEKTSNADSPIMHGHTPILTMDVWEHAYYLDYQNLRPKYIEEFFKVIDWQAAEERYQANK
jgi:superoxide dismutase, Fe-Mn family